MPELLVEEDIRDGRLAAVLVDAGPPASPMHLVLLPDRRPTPKLQSFVQFVLAELGPTSPL